MSSTFNGSYYIRVRPTGWYVWFQAYSDNKRTQARVDQKAYPELGFKPEMSVDEAKARCALLNKERSLIKNKIRLTAKRVTELKTVNETLFPQNEIERFSGLLEDENFGTAAHLKKIVSQFNFVQKMCNELRIQPAEYKPESKRIYKYFSKQKISLSYAARIISLLNRWGKFKSKETLSFYDDVTVPKGNARSLIADAQQTKSGTDTELGVRTESLPLHPEALEKAKSNLKPEQYNWLYLSVWLGLRPEEVESLKNEKRFKIEYSIRHKIYLLKVYQSKLRSIATDKRWKTIPVILPEQSKAIVIVKEKNFSKPLNKIVRKYISSGITLYGGRKGFVDLMLSKGQKLEDISLWLGHKDISTTWKHYKDKEEVYFTPVLNSKVK